MTDPRWAALAAEIAYEINPASAVIPGKEILARVARFVEASRDNDVASLGRVINSVDQSQRGPFPKGAYVMLMNGKAKSAAPGAIARVLGYRLGTFSENWMVLQWSDDELRGGQLHGGYYADDFILVAEDDPF